MTYNHYQGAIKSQTRWRTVVAAVSIAMALAVGMTAQAFAASNTTRNGFDQYGYNDRARIFVGTGSSWCQGKLSMTKTECDAYMGAYANDKLVMKWNKTWDECNTSFTDKVCKGATLTNEWNGNVPGGSGDTEHFKAVWYSQAGCGADGTKLPDGGYCIWGSYEVIMDHGQVDGQREVWAHAKPNGFGVQR